MSITVLERIVMLLALCIVNGKHKMLICDFSVKDNSHKIIVIACLFMLIHVCACDTDSLVGMCKVALEYN
jgi:hypothetical protein